MTAAAASCSHEKSKANNTANDTACTKEYRITISTFVRAWDNSGLAKLLLSLSCDILLVFNVACEVTHLLCSPSHNGVQS